MLPRTRIYAGQRRRLDLGECWEYRELLYFLVWRDLKVRYKQTALGVAWSVLQPLAAMGVFSIFFGRFAAMPSDGVPYPVFSLAALVPWTYFAAALTNASQSLVGSRQLIEKVYFPRLIVPIASVLTPLADFAVAFVALVAVTVAFHSVPSLQAVTVVAFVLLAVGAALAGGLWFAAVTVAYRDVRYVLPFIVQLGLFVTPVAYSSSIVPPHLRWLLGLNPMATAVDGVRWALLGTPAPSTPMVLASVGVVGALLASGVRYFRRLEGTLADVI